MKKLFVPLAVVVVLLAAFSLFQPSQAQVERTLESSYSSSGGFWAQSLLDEFPLAIPSIPPWYNTSWSYRVPVTISNPSTALTDYQVLITLGTGFGFAHAQADGRDLRVTDSDGVTEVDFWVEAWDSANQIAYVWVKVPSVPAGGSRLYLYYGNATASAAGSGSATFDFYEDNWCPYTGATGCPPTNPVQFATQSWWETYTTYPMVFEDTSFAGRPRYHMLYDGHAVIGHAKGYAYSADLNTWTEYDMGTPHPPNPNPIIGTGYAGGTPYAWGDTVKVGSTYYMFASRGPGTTQRIESTNLITWTNFTTLVEDDPGGNIGTGVAILKEPDGITPVVVDAKYWMVYYHGGTAGTMYIASSPVTGTLQSWTYAGSLLSPSASGFDANGLWTPSFIRFGDMYYIYYQGQSSSGLWETGYGRASAYSGGLPIAPDAGSTSWSKSDTNGDGTPDSVLKVGGSGSWDSGYVIDPMVRQFDGVYYLFYTGNQNNGYATASAPGGPWTKLGSGASGQWTTRAGTPTVSGGVLTLPAGAGITSNTSFQYRAVGYRANFAVGSGLLWGGYIDGSTGARTMVGSVTGQTSRLYLKNYNGSEVTSVLCDGTCRDAFHEYEILWRSGNSLARMDHGAASVALSTQVPAVALPLTFYSYSGSGAALQVDWVYVRQYRSPEPVSAVGVEQGMVDLRIAKEGEPDPVGAGEPLTYTVVVTNSSSEVAPGVVVTDVLPVGANLVLVEAGQGSCVEGVVVVCELGSISGTGWVEITVVITSVVEGAITNTVTVDSEAYELVPGDNRATEVTLVVPSADLWVSQTSEPDPVRTGEQLTYTLTVHNAGPSSSGSVTLTDTLPGDVTFVSAAPGLYCGQASPVVCSLPGLAASGESQVQVVVIATLDGLITNTATVTSPTYDPDLVNNTSENSTVVVTSADLSITQVDYPDPVLAEQELTYTLTVHNTGPSIAANIWLTDTLPGSVILVSAIPNQGSCEAGNVVTCDLGNLTDATEAQVEVVVIPQAEGSITNTVTVVMDTPDANLANNVKAEVTNVLPLSADLQLTLTNMPDPVVAGGLLTYTVQVANLGPSRAINPSVTVDLTSDVAFLSSIPGAPVCIHSGGVVTCVLDEIASGGSTEVTLLTQVSPSVLYGSYVTSQAEVISAVGDPSTGNNHASASALVYTQADLALGIMDHPDPVAPNTRLTYTLVYTNTGPSDAIGLTLTDTLPSVVDYVQTIPEVCSPRPFTHIVDCDLPDLAANQSAQIELVVDVKLGVVSPFVNHVKIASGTPDPESENNVRDETTGIDDVDPTLRWIAPVGNEETYLVVVVPGQAITLTVIATDTVGLDHVRFAFWDHLRGDAGEWVEVGNDYEGESGVYEFVWVLDSGMLELPIEPCQLFAYAYDTAGNYIRKRIWLVPLNIVLLPMIMK